MTRYIDADELLRNTIYNVRHVPYIAESDVTFAPTADVVERKDIEAECELAYKHGWSDCFAERRWIPVTERLPEDQNTVLITDDGGLWYDLGFYSDGDGWSYTSGDYVNYHVSAWVQIPPYRRE